MGRTARHKLTVRQLPTGSYLLGGYVLGERVRERHGSIVEAMMAKSAYEEKARNALAMVPVDQKQVNTTLTVDQVRRFERWVYWANEHGRDMEALWEFAQKHGPSGHNISAWDALGVAEGTVRRGWLGSLADRHRSLRVLDKNRLRVRALLKLVKNPQLSDITPELLEKHILRPGISVATQVEDGRVIRAWLDWCVKRGWIKGNPFTIDLRDLAQRAGRSAEKPRILTPEQVEALWVACRDESGGKMTPYIVLALFCFLRHSEACRVVAGDIDFTRGTVGANSRKVGTVSYRTVNLPPGALPYLRVVGGIYYSKKVFLRIREKAKLLDIWQENILRHTGISYLFQKLSASADKGEFSEQSVIASVCRQAANTPDTAFRYYVALPRAGDYEKFYGVISG